MTATHLPGSRRAIVTVGTFDGIHRGHQEILVEIVRRARKTGRASVLVTFEPHPLKIVAPERAPCLLSSAAEKRLLWPLFGLDYVHVLPFTEALRQLPPEDFVRRILIDQLRVGELVIGYDHGFGKDRKGDAETLRRLGTEMGFGVDVVGPVEVGQSAISSRRIRHAVAVGDLTAATAALGRPYSVLGEVVRGAGRGRGLGFPTANIRLDDPAKCLPPEAVYAVRVDIGGEWFDAMANLGPRPTFGERNPRFEAHLLDWSPGEPLYGERPMVGFVARLRGVRRFGDPGELIAQLERDREDARILLAREAAGVGGGVA